MLRAAEMKATGIMQVVMRPMMKRLLKIMRSAKKKKTLKIKIKKETVLQTAKKQVYPL